MEIAENTVLVTAVVWVVWQVLSLRNMALNGGVCLVTGMALKQLGSVKGARKRLGQ